MNPKRDPEAVQLEFSNPHDSLSDPDSDCESLSWSEYKRSLKAAEIGFDIATTHKRNKELRERDAVVRFFGEVQSIETVDKKTLEGIGSLPRKMTGEAIPLFTDDLTGTEYQLHFSYTWMGGLRTARSTNVEIIDPHVHSLLRVKDSDDLGLISPPNMVVPLGKLFVNESDRSKWTGYEIFMSSRLELWIIYILNEDDLEKVHPVECNLLRATSAGREQDGPAEEVGNLKLARLWTSLRNLQSASFKEAAEEVQSSYYTNDVGSIYLLQISVDEVSLAISFSNRPVVQRLRTSRLNVNPSSKAGKELLWLAIENADMAILRLVFELDVESAALRAARDKIQPDNKELLSLAAEFGDEAMVKLLLDNGNAKVNTKYHGRTPLSFAAGSGHEATVKLLLERQDVEADSKVEDINSKYYGRTPLSFAAENGHEATVKLLLELQDATADSEGERQDVEADSRSSYGRTPLPYAAWNYGTEGVKR